MSSVVELKEVHLCLKIWIADKYGNAGEKQSNSYVDEDADCMDFF